MNIKNIGFVVNMNVRANNMNRKWKTRVMVSLPRGKVSLLFSTKTKRKMKIKINHTEFLVRWAVVYIMGDGECPDERT
jgi:hypothetical protein